jgi:hypothetical protein
LRRLPKYVPPKYGMIIHDPVATVRLYLALLRKDLAAGDSECSREIAKYCSAHGGGWYRNQREEEQVQAS